MKKIESIPIIPALKHIGKREGVYDTENFLQQAAIQNMQEVGDMLVCSKDDRWKITILLGLLHKLAMNRGLQNTNGGVGIRALLLADNVDLLRQWGHLLKTCSARLQLSIASLEQTLSGLAGTEIAAFDSVLGADIVLTTPTILSFEQKNKLDLSTVQFFILNVETAESTVLKEFCSALRNFAQASLSVRKRILVTYGLPNEKLQKISAEVLHEPVTFIDETVKLDHAANTGAEILTTTEAQPMPVKESPSTTPITIKTTGSAISVDPAPKEKRPTSKSTHRKSIVFSFGSETEQLVTPNPPTAIITDDLLDKNPPVTAASHTTAQERNPNRKTQAYNARDRLFARRPDARYNPQQKKPDLDKSHVDSYASIDDAKRFKKSNTSATNLSNNGLTFQQKWDGSTQQESSNRTPAAESPPSIQKNKKPWNLRGGFRRITNNRLRNQQMQEDSPSTSNSVTNSPHHEEQAHGMNRFRNEQRDFAGETSSSPNRKKRFTEKKSWHLPNDNVSNDHKDLDDFHHKSTRQPDPTMTSIDFHLMSKKHSPFGGRRSNRDQNTNVSGALPSSYYSSLREKKLR